MRYTITLLVTIASLVLAGVAWGKVDTSFPVAVIVLPDFSGSHKGTMKGMDYYTQMMNPEAYKLFEQVIAEVGDVKITEIEALGFGGILSRFGRLPVENAEYKDWAAKLYDTITNNKAYYDYIRYYFFGGKDPSLEAYAEIYWAFVVVRDFREYVGAGYKIVGVVGSLNGDKTIFLQK